MNISIKLIFALAIASYGNLWGDERINAILFQTNACAYVTWWQFNLVPTSKSIENILAKKNKNFFERIRNVRKKISQKSTKPAGRSI